MCFAIVDSGPSLPQLGPSRDVGGRVTAAPPRRLPVVPRPAMLGTSGIAIPSS
eukprot:CAMPEP_0118971660 /NCGR_PEP_ID=MMETSP1173-20130426/8221_1 /TAXON_ID=1034831 /ORGANISM="Rhizochromulina marina cf, Strain CCMP1243" /LENGTH=52 /DNA_ID=CAMNT_0006921137 /DNA_START=1 /DNA_END=156 /DNA_ORIENTATION=+